MIFRILFGLLLILFLSGFSLTAMLFPKRYDLDDIERIALSFILSLVVTPLLGLMLNFTPFGIRLLPVLFVLSAFTVSVSLFAWDRRSKLTDKERFKVLFKIPKFILGQSKLDKILTTILIGVIIGSFATLTYVVMNPRVGERFTEFYLLDLNGTASNYPMELKLGDVGELIVMVVNHEFENATYRIVVNFNDRQIIDYHVFVIDTEMWERPFTFQATEKGENQKLEFILYKDQEIYRTLHLWVNVT